MKILIYMGCISENTIFTQFCVILPDVPTYIHPALNVSRNIWPFSGTVSNNQELLAKFHFGTLQIKDIMRLMLLFELFLEFVLKCSCEDRSKIFERSY